MSEIYPQDLGLFTQLCCMRPTHQTQKANSSGAASNRGAVDVEVRYQD